MSREGGPAMSMCRNSKKSPEGVAIREDPLLKNLKEN